MDTNKPSSHIKNDNIPINDFFELNIQQPKKSWWKKLLYGKVKMGGCYRNPLIFKFFLLYPFFIFLLIKFPQIHIAGYGITLVFLMKAITAYNDYIKNKNNPTFSKNRERFFTLMDWSGMSFSMIVATIIL